MFTRTKHGANHLAEQLNKDGIRSAAIHGINRKVRVPVRWLILNRVTFAYWWRPISLRAVWISKSCRTSSTMNCQTYRKIMSTVSGVPVVRLLPVKRCRWCVLMNTNCCVISKTAEKRSRALRFRAMSRTRQSKPNRSRTVASNVAAAVVGKVVVAVNSNHAVGKVAQNLQARNLQKNRLAASAMPNRQANNNVAAVRVNLLLRGNL